MTRLVSTIHAMQMAYKRAKHFALPFDGPFSVIGTEGPSIAARNYCWLLDADRFDSLGRREYRPWYRRHRVTRTMVVDLQILSMWAVAINRYCDANHVMSVDGDDRNELAGRCCRVWGLSVGSNV